MSRLAGTIVTGFVGALIAFVGLTMFNTPPAVLIALLLVFARISAPVMQMSQMAQQFAHLLPAYAEVRALERELSAPGECKRRPHVGGNRAGADRFPRRDVSLSADEPVGGGRGSSR